MYLDYFGLERDPFTISPDPAFLYPSPQHRQALAHLKYGLDREGGFILLTGEVGTGKTTLTRLFLEQLPGNIRVAYILNAKLNSLDVLASICAELGVPYSPDDSIKTLTDHINRDLLAAHSQGKKTLVVIEEAQNLDPDILEMLRLLTNLETNSAKLMHILLVGQPELLDLIARNELRQLNQRVISRFHLEPLDLRETTSYLAYRLRRAGCGRALFDSGAIKKMHRLSGGVPRVLNLLAERSLLGAYATNSKRVSRSIVDAASREVFGARGLTQRGEPRSIFAASILAVCVLAAGAYVLIDRQSFVESTSSLPALENPVPEEAATLPEPTEAQLETSAETSPDDVEDVVDELEPQPVKNVNAFEQLLEIWGITVPATDRESLCLIASQNGLFCQQDSGLMPTELLEINRPGLVRLNPTEESQHLYVLTGFEDGALSLSNSREEQNLALDVFEQQWDGEYLYLWPALNGYQGLVAPGTRNPDLVSWVQQQLAEVMDGYEYIYNGGMYSSLIAERVAAFQASQGLKADGLLGPRTLLRLMEQTQSMPALVADQAVSPLVSEEN
jgi:general secretion pathway protein A